MQDPTTATPATHAGPETPQPTTTGETDTQLARRLAAEAGERLTRLRADHQGADPRTLGDLGDRAAHEFLLAQLRRHRPQDAVLSEEAPDHPDRPRAERVWIVDPLDGTSSYAAGRPYWAVHVALHEAGRGITAAAVAAPEMDYVRADDEVTGPEASDDPEHAPRIVISDNRPPAFAEAVADSVGAELVPMSSAGAKAVAVLRGQAQAYLHAGGQWEWDSAAPVGLARAAGLHTSRIDGAPLRYNRSDPYLPDLLLCRPDLADPILRAIADAT